MGFDSQPSSLACDEGDVECSAEKCETARFKIVLTVSGGAQREMLPLKPPYSLSTSARVP